MEFKKEYAEIALSYEAYNQHAESLLSKISSDNTNPMQHYAGVNLHILRQLKESVHLTGQLENALRKTQPIILVILTEGYCGDSAQILPVFGKMQSLFPDNVEVKVISRDRHLTIADDYFETRAIPTVLCLDKETFERKFIWGSRPAPAQRLMDELKARNVSQQVKSMALQAWYEQDNTETLQQEIGTLLLAQK